ncbi:cyclase family protein [Streptosporangium sp. NBC_01755]|nr:cyclase family protein [Streptosporangium sp. NBC_01755]WSA28194.1 cyclase family protein [Streptosporangium sp. NBC_01810]WSD00329.1 cyclase family protein [Streptosporangium sp. NBC_01755]
MDRDAGDYALGARAPHGFRFAEDTVQLPTHSGTHLDALCHVWEGDALYNGHPASGVRSTRGADRCGAEALRPVVTRGVLVDMQEHLGRPLEAGEAVTAQLLRLCLDERGVHLEPGDAVLIRTGWWERGLSAEVYHRAEPGIDLAAAWFLAEQDVSLVGADNYAIEQQPSAPGTSFPVHLCLLHKFGVPMLENLDLSRLAEALRQRGRSVFALVVAPLPLQGSTAAPVCPVAVL